MAKLLSLTVIMKGDEENLEFIIPEEKYIELYNAYNASHGPFATQFLLQIQGKVIPHSEILMLEITDCEGEPYYVPDQTPQYTAEGQRVKPGRYPTAISNGSLRYK